MRNAKETLTIDQDKMTTCPTTGLPLPKMPEGIERTTPREMSDKVRKQLAEDARTGIRKP